jgi:hypothetical protein
LFGVFVYVEHGSDDESEMDWTHDSISGGALKRPRIDNCNHTSIYQTTFSAASADNRPAGYGGCNQVDNSTINPISCPDDSYVQNGATSVEEEAGKVSAECCYGMVMH